MNTWDQKVVKVGVKNNSGERVPPFGVLELDYTGTSAVALSLTNEVVWQVKKPTTTGVSDRARILINGPAWIEIGGYGSAILNPAMCLVLFNSSTSPTVGGGVGPVASQWYMSTTGSGWLYKSNDVVPEAYNQSSTIKSAYVELVGGGVGIFLYTLLSTTTANIRNMADTVAIASAAPIVDTLSMFSDQVAGDRGICGLSEGVYYRINGPCKT